MIRVPLGGANSGVGQGWRPLVDRDRLDSGNSHRLDREATPGSGLSTYITTRRESGLRSAFPFMIGSLDSSNSLRVVVRLAPRLTFCHLFLLFR